MTAIWITRTEPSATRLQEHLLVNDLTCHKWPLLDIEMLSSAPPVRTCDVLIVLSAHAVRSMDIGAVVAGQVFAIGESTYRALLLKNIVSSTPEETTSEGLMNLIQAKVCSNASVLLVSGEDGRKWLRDELIVNGYQVYEWAVYRRLNRTDFPVDEVTECDFIEVSSISALETLQKCIDATKSEMKSSLRLVVPSHRILKTCRELGFQNLRLARGASVEAITAVVQSTLSST